MEITAAPPGHDQSTRSRVVRSVLVNGPSTTADLALRLGLTPAAVRRHLDQLLDDGLLEARTPRSSAVRGRGRPAKVFALTEAGRDSLDQAYDDLAVQAIRFLAETGGPQAVREFADRRAEKIERRFEDLVAAEPDLRPAHALAQVFTNEGYAAAVRDLPVGEQLCQQHCPVSHVAHEFPELCEAETAAISRMLGRHVQRLATIAHGDGVCTTCIPDLVSTSSTGVADVVSTSSTGEPTGEPTGELTGDSTGSTTSPTGSTVGPASSTTEGFTTPGKERVTR